MEQDPFLAAVRESLERGGELPLPAPAPYEPSPPPAAGELLSRLASELEAVGGQVCRVASTAAAREKILEILRGRGARWVVRDDTALVRCLDLDGELGSAGCEVTVSDLGDGTAAERLREAAFDADAGITSVDGAVAETGTLALVHRPGQGRSISLLPPVHIAVLDRRDVVWDLGELFPQAREAVLPSALTLITGPSRTGDIELVLTVGVHGPGELHVVVIDGE